jgi:hypothetical protein
MAGATHSTISAPIAISSGSAKLDGVAPDVFDDADAPLQLFEVGDRHQPVGEQKNGADEE